MRELFPVDLLLLDAWRREESDHSGSSSSATEAAMARLEAVDLLLLDARRRDAAAVLRAAWGCDAYKNKKSCASS